MKIEVLKETTLYVSNLEASESFYSTIIGLVVADRVQDQYSLLHFVDGSLLLYQTPSLLTENQGASLGQDKVGQLSFGISSADISSWRMHLRKHNVSIEKDIAWPNGSQSLIFRDPSQNRVELKTQTATVQGLVTEDPLGQHIPGGLDAKWKIYHALKPEKQKESPSGG